LILSVRSIIVLAAYYVHVNMLFEANAHPSARTNNLRRIYLRLTAVPIFMAACVDIYEGRLSDRLHYDDDAADGTALALDVVTTIDTTLWLLSCAGFLAVLIMARRGLCERLRDLVDARPLFDRQPAARSARSQSAHGGGVASEDSCNNAAAAHYASTADNELVASLNGAIWTLTALGWAIACFMLCTAFFAVAIVTFGYPGWVYFLLVGFVYGLPGMAPLPVFGAVLGRDFVRWTATSKMGVDAESRN
ncbi:hypothetical protein HK101_002756, partial [Irineochytrium annulatum]